MTDVEFIDASNWNEQVWLSSGGTRAKKILLDENGQSWFFKCSEKKEAKGEKPAKHYKYEFWSEILAYQLGKAWGLNVLRYDPACFGIEIGCISKSMHKPGQEQLLEVGRFMVAISEDFLPAHNETRDQYTFQLLANTLDHFELAKYWDQFFQTLLFDAVIGNTDRHQENWAFIGTSSLITKYIEVLENGLKSKGLIGWMIGSVNRYLPIFDKQNKKLNKEGEEFKLYATSINRMAPIYDSGSSMARELNEERVVGLLKDEAQLLKYIEDGKAEIHWNKKKLSHFNFVLELLNSSYIEELKKAGYFLSNMNDVSVKDIINNIDASLPEAWAEYKIPQSRKDLIYKLVTLRSEKLGRLLS